ncbi:hypothetical protein LJR245_007439 [Rhizobium leguminosarum]|uniref:hypothetical protein n=1 Tax=Rhizobium leguminosarum TaxID=384 RepID=UPI003ECE07E0
MANATNPVDIRISNEAQLFLRARVKGSTTERMRAAKERGDVLVQPRCGVGSHEAQLALLRRLSREAGPDISTITVDSYTRLGAFEKAADIAKRAPERLNGYPVVAHGAEKVREIVTSLDVPIQIRHGSPDPRVLFATALEGGVDGFEGGPLCYTLPYSKEFPLLRALHAWDEVDEMCGYLAAQDIEIDREFFGSLSGTLIHPVIALSLTFIEAIKAFGKGGRSGGIAISQSGCVYQDIAALRAIAILSEFFFPDKIIYPVFHHFMGVFPKDVSSALSVIAQGSITARLGGATKVVVKTEAEAIGIPDVQANVKAINFSRIFLSSTFDGFMPREERIEEEAYYIVQEVKSLVSNAFTHSNVNETIVALFARGILDVPFCPSHECQGLCIPRRGLDGAIRFADPGRMDLSAAFLEREKSLVGSQSEENWIMNLTRDIEYFARGTNVV